MLWRSSPQSMRGDLEIICMLLFGWKPFQLALCNVGWFATQESVVHVPDPIVFAPWSVLLDRGELCDSCEDTSHSRMLSARLMQVVGPWKSGKEESRC